MLTFANIVLILAATTTALSAGLFYSWSCSVMPGLARVSDTSFVESMQAMNRAILNPVFFASFMGAAILLLLSLYLQYHQPISTRWWFLLAATIIYLAGVLGVTMAGNVPLNDALDKFPLSASAEEYAAQRKAFEETWVRLNTIRSFAGLFSIVLVIIACLSHSEK